MTHDRSLDEFLGGDDVNETADSEDADTDAASAPSDECASAAVVDGDSPADAPADGGDDGDDGNRAPVGDTDDADETVMADDGGDAAAADAPRPDASAVDPATSTYRWTPAGAACESCGATVERRWADDGAFVCDDCKSW